MSKRIEVDFYCQDCHGATVLDARKYECPNCKSHNVVNTEFLTCDCGKLVYLHSHTNFCKCGRLYNGFGQELAPPEDWNPEDVYGIFGPQN